MASIHPTPYGTFEVKWRENGVPKSKTRKTKGQAEELKGKVERRVAGGRQVFRSQDVPILEEFAASWLAKKKKKLEASTYGVYKEWLEVHILPELGHLPLTALTARRLAEWQEMRLEDGAGPAVLGKAQAVLGQILKKAVLPWEYLDSNPVDALDRPEYRKRDHKWLTAFEVEAIRMWFIEREDLGSATFISGLAYIGPRPGNQLARLWTDLLPKPPKWFRNPAPHSGALRVTTRNSQGVIKGGTKTNPEQKDLVYIPAPVVQDFEEWRIASNGTGLIYPRRKDGLPWTKSDFDNWRSRMKPDGSVGYSFKQAAKETGVGDVTPYALRHTAATLYAAAGGTLVEIGQQIQHSPQTSARLYQHLTHEALTGESIDDYIWEARGVARPVRDSFGAENHGVQA